VLRDFQAKESNFKSVVSVLPDPTSYCDANIVAPFLKIIEQCVEKFALS